MAPRSDAEEFTQLVERRWFALVRVAMLLGCSPAEAEDVTQAALTH
jgi:DNA-directed RNA polymerase specialized sigma24 family protein